MLKKYINDNCFSITKNLTKKLNNRVTLKSWWVNRGVDTIYDDILAQTTFLDIYAPSFAERIYCIMNDLSSRPVCKVCSGQVSFHNYQSGYWNHCSQKCSTQSTERNALIGKNRDGKKILEATKKSNLEKYGVPFTTMLTDVIQKARTTKMNRYGDSSYNNPTKSKETCLQRYGYEYSGQVPEIIQKIQDNKVTLYPQLRNKEWLVQQNTTKSITQIADELGCSYRTVYLYFDKYNITPNFFSPDYSKQQKELHDFVTSIYQGTILLNDRNVIKPKELDIYLPEIGLAIEFNGMYWHAEDNKRHLVKHMLCKKENITLLQVWDHEWVNKREIVESIIRSKIGKSVRVYGRDCTISKINSKEYADFLEKNHIQGKVNSSIRYALLYENEVISVMGLGKSRYGKVCSHELLRFATKLNHSVVGGFSKLLKHILRNEELDSIATYADLRLFDGGVYEKSGFVFSHTTNPGYVYYKSGIVSNRQRFQKHKLETLLPKFDASLSESVNMNNNGFLRVYDCGQNCFTLNCSLDITQTH